MLGWIAAIVTPSLSGGVALHVFPPSLLRSTCTCHLLGSACDSVLEPATKYRRLAQTVGTLVPDATSASVILLLVVAGAALALGTAPGAVVDAYYRGLWMLLPFTMQMTLILVLSAVVSGTPFFRRLVVGLARKPRTLTQVIVVSVLLNATASYFYWGLGLALSLLLDSRRRK